MESPENEVTATRAAVFGYGPEAREQACRLREIGWQVDVVVRAGGMSWIRAMADGFRPVAAAEAAARANIVVMHLPESELPAVWAYGVGPHLAPGSLVVFARAYSLHAGAFVPDRRLDVALIATRAGGATDTADAADATGAAGASAECACRVAVHQDATGHALERVTGAARAIVGGAATIGTTTIDVEVQAEISELIARAGGLARLLAELDRVLANPSHEPDEATLAHFERLRATVLAGIGTPRTIPPPKSRVILSRTGVSRKRGAA
jgi:ketol-acid reductoisomerase